MSTALSGAIRALYARPYLLLVLCMICWAGNIVVMRAATDHVPQMALSFIRWTLACLLFLPMTWPFLKRDWPMMRGALALMILLSLTGMAVPNQLTLFGLKYTTALNALLLQSITPLLIAAWALVLFGDRLTWLQILGIAISLVGVVVIVCQGDLGLLASLTVNPGDVVIFLGLLIFASYSALATKRPKAHPFSFLWTTMAIGAVVMAPFTAGEYAIGYRMSLDVATVLTILYLTVFGSVISLLFFNRAIELVGPNRTAPFMNLVPVFGSAMAIVFLAEVPRLYHLIGYALVLIGLYAGTRRA